MNTRPAVLLTFLAALWVLLLPPNSRAAPGDLDTSFNGTGKVSTPIGNSSDVAQSVAVQSDGKIVVAGYSYNGSNFDFAVVRYTSAGALDTTFGGTGKVTTPIGSSDDVASCVAIQSDGKIVVAGFSIDGLDNFAVVRYTDTGALDTTFGGTGKVITPLVSSNARGSSMAVQRDGKIVVAGFSGNSGNANFAVVRYTAAGALDLTFGGTGKVITDFGGDSDVPSSMALQSDGKIVVAGYSGSDFALARYTGTGVLDASFGGTGMVTTDISGGSYDVGSGVAIQSDGKIVLSGYSAQPVSGYDIAVVRYTSTGALDTTFNSTGKLTTPVGSGGNDDRAFSTALQSDGKIVVAGYSAVQPGNGYNFAVVRYTSAGGLDTTFNGTGKVVTDIGSSYGIAQNVALQSDGKIIAVGFSNNGSTSNDFAVVRYLGDTPGPTISGVAPSTVPGSNSPQSFTVNGTNFDPGCIVTLRDLTTGIIYSNRTKIAQTPTSITLNPTFGTSAHTWSVEVINPGPSSSGPYQFLVTSPASLVSVAVTGPSSLAAGGTTDYTATATFSNGPPQDVSNQASWSVSGGPTGTHMSGQTLIAGSGAASTATVSASYSGTTGTRNANEAVAIGSNWSAFVGFASATYELGSSPPQWILDAVGVLGGDIPMPITSRWKLDGVAIGPTNGALNHVPVGGAKGSRKLEFTVTDGTGFTRTNSNDIVFNVPAITEPPSTHPPDDPHHLATVYGSDGHLLHFDSGKTGTGFILITHGLTDDALDPWLKDMAQHIERRLADEGKPIPNIALYDWKTNADPHTATDYDSSFRNQLDSYVLFGSGSKLLGTTYDFQHIEPLAKEESLLLAAWLLRQIKAGYIDPAQPIHLIGHSAGGFVIGEAATYLKQKGYIVDLVTMLDTPDPIDRNFTEFPNPGHVERYISSVLGIAWSYNRVGEHQVPVSGPLADIHVAWAVTEHAKTWDPTDTSGSNVQPNAYYHREVFPLDYFAYKGDSDKITLAHQAAYITYDFDTVIFTGATGFWNSPFLHGSRVDKTGWNGMTPTLKGATPSHPNAVPANSTTTLSDFQTFGTVSPIAGGYQITEQDNAGILKQMAFSYGAITLRFKYCFTTPGDGDFISVRIGDSAPLYVAADNEITENGFVTGEIPLAGFANSTDTLIFTLISRGDPNAVVQVKDFELIESDDPDGDGLTTTQELTLGTNPLMYDTDGDGIGDGDEVNIYHTNPLLADTDGDGIADADEIAAGTNPLDPKSGFKVVGVQHLANGSFVLNWSAVAGKTYRVLRSATPDFSSFDVVGAGIEPVGTAANYTDSSVPPGMISAFYRVQAE